MRSALGIIEAIGLTTAIAALDAASKAADITLVGYDKVIGVEKSVSVVIHIAGEVAAVNAAVESGVAAGNKVGRVVASRVIPRPHEELDFLIKEFERNLKENKERKEAKKQQKEDKGEE